MRLFVVTSCLFLLINNVSFAATNGSCKTLSPITFAILPFVSTKQLVIRFTPLVNYLSHHLDADIRIETAPNFSEFTHRTVETNRYDILFTAPHFFPQAHDAGYQLIASVDSPGMRALIVVPKNSNIKNLNDLKGKRLATASANSLATLLVKKHLTEHNINPDKDLTLITTPTHDASLLSTYHNITDASALMQPPYAAASKQVRDNMRILAKTHRAPHIPLSVSKRISKACANEISTHLINMKTTKEGKQVLKHNRFSGFQKVNLEKYEHFKHAILDK